MATTLLKRFVCPRCNAPSAMSPRTPFVQCGSCGTVGDFDLGVARRHPDWPRHEALQQELWTRHRPELDEARAAGDRARWTRVYAELLAALIDRCPAVYPARVDDAAYRARLVAFQSHHNANLALEPALIEQQRELTERSRAIVHDAAGWKAATLWPVFDLALAYFEAQDRYLADQPPPDDFAPGWMRHLGASLIAQEWLPRLGHADQLDLVGRLGLARAYVAPWTSAASHCGGCGEDLEPPSEGTARVACRACARELDLARGAFGCQTCGVTVHVVVGAEHAACPYCAADLRESRMGLEARERSRRLFAFADSELALIEELVGAKVVAIEVLDGPVVRRELPWRMVTFRARFASAPPRTFFENTDVDDAPSHDELDAWLEVQARDRGVPHARSPYREHPEATTLPTSIAEIERRLAELAPGAVAIARHYGPSGWTIEAEVDGRIVRAVGDETGAGGLDLYRPWGAR